MGKHNRRGRALAGDQLLVANVRRRRHVQHVPAPEPPFAVLVVFERFNVRPVASSPARVLAATAPEGPRAVTPRAPACRQPDPVNARSMAAMIALASVSFGSPRVLASPWGCTMRVANLNEIQIQEAPTINFAPLFECDLSKAMAL